MNYTTNYTLAPLNALCLIMQSPKWTIKSYFTDPQLTDGSLGRSRARGLRSQDGEPRGALRLGPGLTWTSSSEVMDGAAAAAASASAAVQFQATFPPDLSSTPAPCFTKRPERK